jgi:hypothetical protein
MNTNSVKIIEDVVDKRYQDMMSNVSLVKYLMKEYKISQSRAYDYIKEAKIQVGEYYTKVNENILQDTVTRLEVLLETAISENNSKLSLDIIREIGKLNKLYQDQITLDADSITININKNV